MSNINFTYTNLTPFKWYVLENFPFIEADFDALTNWQLFCKIGKEMNKIINSVNTSGMQVENLTIAFNNLQDFVNNYFNNLDVQDEINNKLDKMAQDGTLTNLIRNYIDPIINSLTIEFEDLKNELSIIANGSPAGVFSSVSELESNNPDHNKIYVVSENGEWYYWNNTTSSWQSGGVYQSSVNPNQIEDLKNDIDTRLSKVSIPTKKITVTTQGNNMFNVNLPEGLYKFDIETDSTKFDDLFLTNVYPWESGNITNFTIWSYSDNIKTKILYVPSRTYLRIFTADNILRTISITNIIDNEIYNKFNETISKIFNNNFKTSQSGFLNNNNEYTIEEGFHSISTIMLPTLPAVTYKYKGKGDSSANCALFFNKNQDIIGNYKAISLDNFVEITTPDDCYFIKFSSYTNNTNEKVIFDLIFPTNSLFYNTLNQIEENTPLVNLLKSYQEEGFNITSHSFSHGSMWDLGKETTVNPNDVYKDIIKSYEILAKNNIFDFKNFVTPNGVKTGIPQQCVKNWSNCLISSSGGINTGFNNRYSLNREFIEKDKGLSYYTNLIDSCISSKGWLIFGTHSGDVTWGSNQFDVNFIKSVLQYAINNNVEILPLNASYNKRKCLYDYYEATGENPTNITPLITIIDDDGLIDYIPNMKNMCDELNIKCTFAVIVNKLLEN